MSFSNEFLWGVATSAFQYEGAYLEDGKGLNVYDTLVVTPEPGIKPMFLYNRCSNGSLPSLERRY